MAVIFLLASFLLTTLILYLKERQFRDSFLKSCIVHGCLIMVSTEALSWIKSLDFTHIASLWIVSTAINSFILWSRYRNKIRGCLPRANLKALDVFSQISIITVVLVISISLITALLAPPNNWDSMTYHMPRVMHWIQNRSVDHYPTHTLRQISFPPGAAYIVTHLQILVGGDRFANCVQWIAFVGSILGISLITKKLVGEKAQWVSMLLCASLPMAIAQSTTTQTDLVMSFWLVSFTYFLFNLTLHSPLYFFWISASLGLAFITKPTAFIYGAPLFAVFGLLLFQAIYIKRRNFSKALLLSSLIWLLVGLGSLVFSIPSWLRNTQTFGHFLGIDMGTRSSVNSLAEFLSVLLKNLALNLPIPGFNQLVNFTHYLIGVDINKPSLTWGEPSIPFSTPIVSPINLLFPFEDTVASPIHLILGVISLFYLLFNFRAISKNNQHLLILLVIILSGISLYSYLLKWQPWGNRLLLSLFILQTPITAYYLTRSFISERANWLRNILGLLAIMSVLYALCPIRHPLVALPYWSPYLASHQSKSILLLKREQIYFSGSFKFLEITYPKIVDTVVEQYRCHSVGFVAEDDQWEYPLWVLFHQKTAGNFRLKNIQVRNESAKLKPEFSDSEICAIVWSNGKTQPIRSGTPR